MPFGAVVYFAGLVVPPHDRKEPGTAKSTRTRISGNHRIDWPLAYLSSVAARVSIEPVGKGQLERLLPLIAAYQRFYEVEEIDEERNRAFFSRFLAPSENGMLLGAWRDRELVGYACLYWSFTSLVPAETVLMNDLYVAQAARGQGVGRALIEASAAAGRERGAQRLEWVTASDNETAQRLYDTTGAERSSWIEYELPLDR